MSSSHHSFASPAEALRALFAAWPADRGEGTGFAEAYIIAVQGYSLKAIDGAVKRIIRGEAEDIDRRFLPSPAQLGNVVAYLEKLYAPPEPRQALPAPGDGVRTADEQARIDALVNGWRKSAGREVHRGETVLDRDEVPAAKLAALDKVVMTVAERIKADGLPKLSDEAMALFRQKAGMAVPDPAEQFDEWDRSTPDLPTPLNGRERAA